MMIVLNFFQGKCCVLAYVYGNVDLAFLSRDLYRPPPVSLAGCWFCCCQSRDFVQRSLGRGRWFLYTAARSDLCGRARLWPDAFLRGNQAGILLFSGQHTNVNIFMMSLCWPISLKRSPTVSCLGCPNLVASFLKAKLGKHLGVSPSSLGVSPSRV